MIQYYDLEQALTAHAEFLYLFGIFIAAYRFDNITQQCPVRILQGVVTGTGVMGGPILLN